MKMTEKQIKELANESGRFILFPIGFLNLLFLIAFFASIFMCIWGHDLWAKVMITSALGILITGFIHMRLKKLFIQAIKEELESEKNETKVKEISKFQERLEQAQKMQKEQLSNTKTK